MRRSAAYILRPRRRGAPVIFLLWAGAVTLALAGCSDTEYVYVDAGAPGIPAGVSSITGDGAVYVRWLPNKEPDLAGYRVWWDGDGDEEFEELARISAFEEGVYQDNGTPSAADDFLEYEDFIGFDYNGTYNSYAISAYDDEGNESDLSWELVVDVPRPEGYALRLESRAVSPSLSGYDLRSLSEQPQSWSADTTDFWYEVVGGVPRFYVPGTLVEILDAGFTSYNGFGGLDGVDYAPANGWSSVGYVEAIPGHTYVLRTTELDGIHYAKIWLERFESDRNVAHLWWAYQEVPGERQFGQPRPGDGAPTEFVSGQEVR
jgi:hypothetical protein